MCLIVLLVLIAIIALVIGGALLVTGGSVFIIVFGDILVCVLAIGFFVKFLINRRKK